MTMTLRNLIHFGGILLILILVFPQAQATAIGGVQIFPQDHVWNVPIDTLPVDARSADYVKSIGISTSLHPDFGANLDDTGPFGIPYNVVNNTVTKKTVTFDYADESDAGPYPVPANPLIEGGADSDGDRHILMIHTDEKKLYELYYAWPQPDGSWTAGSGAIYDLTKYDLRPDGWTSADAAGLAILPGLVRYDEVAAGEITHAIRFTAQKTRKAYIWPARHFASSNTSPVLPPMGQKFRLKASFDTSGYGPQSKVVLAALKKYGMILSDNGGNWFISGAPDTRWDDDDLNDLKQLKGSDFEAVNESSLMINANSGRANVVLPGPIALPGQSSAPTDPDKDGKFEDLNANGRKDFADVVLFFEQLDWIVIHEPLAAFDYNSNGRVEYADIVMMYDEL
jgi:PKD repeat protein